MLHGGTIRLKVEEYSQEQAMIMDRQGYYENFLPVEKRSNYKEKKKAKDHILCYYYA
jgi:hypothetical protein